MRVGVARGHRRYLENARVAWPGIALVAAVLLAGCSGTQGGSASSPSGTASQPSAAERSAEVALELQAAVDEASAYATSQGITAGIAVIDRELGTEVVNAAAGTAVRTASLVKLFIADNLLQRQRSGEFQLSAQDAALIEVMLTSSDDSAADLLYERFGQEAMVIEVAQRYGLSSLTPASTPGEWELSWVSAVDVARYYDLFLSQMPAADRDYIVGLLRRISPIAADGFNQAFGLATALAGKTVGIKQGWMCCPEATSYLHSTGIVGPDNRYSVAILTVEPNGSAEAYRTDVLDGIAALIFQPGFDIE